MKKYLGDKLWEANELEGLDLISDTELLEERIDSNLEDGLYDEFNNELLIEDIIKLFAYKRELKKRANSLEQILRKRGE